MSFLFLLALGLVCYGWGRCLCHFCHGPRQRPAIYLVVAGMAVLNVWGGALNALHLATPVSLHLLSAWGILAGLFFLGRDAMGRKGKDAAATASGKIPPTWKLDARKKIEWAIHGLILLFIWRATHWIMPSAALNCHDDFHTYLVRPFRMLAVGSFGGNAFDVLGLDGLGAQSYWHGFFLAWLAPEYAVGFDSVFCFGVLMLLLPAIARHAGLPSGFGLLAAAVLVFINPQIVNISPLYSGSLLMVGVFLGGWFFLEECRGDAVWRQILPVALMVAMLMSLKVTLTIFGVLQLSILIFLSLRNADRRSRILHTSVALACWSGLALLPWVLVCAPSVLEGWRVGSQYASETALAGKYPSITAHGLGALFELKPLFYGGHLAHYHFLAGFSLLVSGLACVRWWRDRANGKETAIWIATAALCSSAAAAYAINAHLFPIDTAVRYGCPALLAAFPIAFLALARVLRSREARHDSMVSVSWLRHSPSAAATVPALLVLFLFQPTFAKRVSQAKQAKSLLASPLDQMDLNFQFYVAQPARRTEQRAIQAVTQPGETILAWTSLPYLLDFERNRILTVSEPGLINPCLAFPAGADPASFHAYLRDMGIRYVMLEVRGYAVKGVPELEPLRQRQHAVYRKLADYAIYARESLHDLARTVPILYEDVAFLVFDLEGFPGILSDASTNTTGG